MAFSGEHDYGGTKVTEASLNGFPSSRIANEIRNDPYERPVAVGSAAGRPMPADLRREL